MSRHLGHTQSACWELGNPMLGPRGSPWGFQGCRSLRHFLEKEAVRCLFLWGNLSCTPTHRGNRQDRPPPGFQGPEPQGRP